MQRIAAQQEPLSKWPLYELLAYGRELGLDLSDDIARKDLVDAVRARQELILELDEQAMGEVLAWAGVGFASGESKEQFAKKIVAIRKMRFGGLSDSGLYALARLRSIGVGQEERREEIIRRLKAAESIWQKFSRKRRRVVASWLARKLVGSPAGRGEAGAAEAVTEFKDTLEDEGLIGGLAGQIKTVADDYVAQKLDEIERRIDQKLDDIDRRLAEWRDREVAVRLRIIKITLAASVLVALLSFGYTALKQRLVSDGVQQSTSAASQQPSDDRSP